MQEKIITASTPGTERRFLDLSAEYINGTNVAFRPGTGECRIRQSFDGGETYDTVEIVSGQNIAGKLETYKRRIELECTGNAVAVLAR